MNEKTIEIYLDNKNKYINEFNDKSLSNDLNNYILEECKGISHKEKLIFLVRTNFIMNDKDKEKFVDMLRNNYGADISEMMQVSKKIYLMNILLFLLGLIFIIFYFLIRNTAILSEVILIIGWVFIWESTYNFFFKGDFVNILDTFYGGYVDHASYQKIISKLEKENKKLQEANEILKKAVPFLTKQK